MVRWSDDRPMFHRAGLGINIRTIASLVHGYMGGLKLCGWLARVCWRQFWPAVSQLTPNLEGCVRFQVPYRGD